MSLMGTLAKVAIGIVVAKGVSSMMRKGAGGGGSAGADGRYGGPHSPRGGAGDLGSVMEDILKGTPGGGPGGGLGGGLGNVLGGGAGGGGLGGILDQLGRAAGPRGSTGNAGGGASGGLGGILGQLAGGAAAGGLGGILGGLVAGAAGGPPAAPSPPPGGGSFGDALNRSLANGGEAGTAGRTPDPAHEAAAGLLLAAMIQAAKADGRIDAAEQKKLTDSLGQASDEEIRFVQAELAKQIDIPGLCAQVPPGMGPQVYGMSLMAIDLDSPLEAQYLAGLAQGLGLDAQAVNAIHAQMGVRPPAA
ncbi:MAG: DUF533 domain-containing protein [Proteobacteria bacterium]|nr:DUF533 domain-containing protein [Pseudomonadota bacterium]MBS0572949.1 DUF533 domain-containing protein [Pseudomonadota bacterium]